MCKSIAELHGKRDQELKAFENLSKCFDNEYQKHLNTWKFKDFQNKLPLNICVELTKILHIEGELKKILN